MRGRDFGQGRFEVILGGKQRDSWIGLHADVPPRKWLYGRYLLRGFVTVLAAPGGSGKSLWAMTVASALAIGRSLLGDYVHQSVKVWIINPEDPLEEFHRRFRALTIHYHIRDDEWRERVATTSEDDGELIISELDENCEVVHPGQIMIEEAILARGYGLVIVDPMIETHTLDENSNRQMTQAMAMWRSIARRTNCAVLIVHHTRKGIVDGADSARGASAVINSARVALTMREMSEEEAETLGIEKKDRLRFVRIDNAKANLAPRADVARWCELVSVQLNNGNAEYPAGDSVGVIVHWKPQTAWSALDGMELRTIFDQLKAGPEDGEYWSGSMRSGDRWAGNVLMRTTAMTKAQAKQVLDTWITNKVLDEKTYASPKANYKERPRIVVNEALANQMITTPE